MLVRSAIISLSPFMLLMAACTQSSLPSQTTTSNAKTKQLVNKTVEASCGQCQFSMDGDGCDLAIRIDGATYFVEGSDIDDHGDAHAEDGLCNCVRGAVVNGEIKNGRFVATSFDIKTKNPPATDNKH